MKTLNLRTIAASLLASSLLAAPAFAQFYVGGGVGAAKSSGLNGSGVSLGVPFTVGGDTTKTSWKLYGGYQFTPNWGIEAQYSDLGKRSANINFGAPINAGGTTSGSTASQWSLAGTGTLPINSNVYLMGKLGASRNKFDSYSLTVAGASATGAGSNKTDLLAGIGIGYDFTKNIGVRFEYENFGKFSSNGGGGGGSIKADNWGASLKYSF